jgi:ubiquinone/menaquinone biosynthesis C-methylase UbiE
MATYAFDHEWQQERQRLAAIETWLDPGTIRHLSDRGVGPGWRCLEVGGGGGSIAAWLADQVGPSGHVLATDLSTRFLETLDRPNLQALRHDIVRDPLPVADFDLAHTRLVLAHLSDRTAGLDRIVAALKPGGWLLVEEMDFVSVALDSSTDPATAALFEKALTAHHQVMRAHSMDPFYGRSAFSELRTHGLSAPGSEGRVFCWGGGSPGTTAWRLTFERLHDEMIATDLITPDELATVIRLFDDPSTTLLSQATVAVWGQRPNA